jgi:hypothetical protein
MESTLESPYLPLRRGLIAVLQQLARSGGPIVPELSQLPRQPEEEEQELLLLVWNNLASLAAYYESVGETRVTTESDPTTPT